MNWTLLQKKTKGDLSEETVTLKETKLSRLMDEIIARHPGSMWGACSLEGSLFEGKYKHCVVFLTGYEDRMTLEAYNEAKFFTSHIASHKRFAMVKKDVYESLDVAKIGFYLPLLFTDYEESVTHSINYKAAARLAGLGWIGKSSLLVVPFCGPRLNPSVFLTDEDVPHGTPINKSYCGECTRCVDNCLFKVINGVTWEPGITRGDQLEYLTCHIGRSRARKVLNRKLACGKCMLACPVGTPEWNGELWDNREKVGQSS